MRAISHFYSYVKSDSLASFITDMNLCKPLPFSLYTALPPSCETLLQWILELYTSWIYFNDPQLHFSLFYVLVNDFEKHQFISSWVIQIYLEFWTVFAQLSWKLGKAIKIGVKCALVPSQHGEVCCFASCILGMTGFLLFTLCWCLLIFPFTACLPHGFWRFISSPLDSQGLAYFPFFKVSIVIAGIYTKRKLTTGNPEEGLHEQFLHHRLVNWRLEGRIYDQGNTKSVFWKKEKFLLTSTSFF